MKIISWNCNCMFREKFSEISKYDADIYIIQECENPENTKNEDYSKFAKNYYWIGANNSKGLGVFAKDNIKLEKLNWDEYCLRYFLPIRVNDRFNLLAVWACDPYIKEYYVYQNININKYDMNMIIMGDFNSNKIWDKKNQERSHMNVINQLKEIGLDSAYHYISDEEQGQETKSTFHLYRHLDKGYHIDHCFCNKNNIKEYEVLYDEKWLNFSDHMPIMLEIKD